MFIGSPWLCIAGGLDVGSSISLNLDEPEADTINTYRLKQLIKRDIQGLTKPGWHAHYAHVIVKMVENYEDNGLIVRDYYEWDSRFKCSLTTISIMNSISFVPFFVSKISGYRLSTANFLSPSLSF
jgi:hypothetical protein